MQFHINRHRRIAVVHNADWPVALKFHFFPIRLFKLQEPATSAYAEPLLETTRIAVGGRGVDIIRSIALL